MLSDYQWVTGKTHEFSIIESDDGKILTGNPDLFDGKKPMVSG